jgi:ATP-dependent helicase IRC3
MQLRDYQQLAVQHSLQRIRDGCLRMYEVLPTGTGKGVILASVAKQRLQAGRVLVLIHRQDIAVQLVKVLEQVELNIGLLMQGRRDLAAPVIVATTQSLLPSSLQALLDAYDQSIATVLIDEAHHAVAGSAYERVITTIEQAYNSTRILVIGFTATPYRSDKQTMLSLLPTCAFERTIPDMVRRAAGSQVSGAITGRYRSGEYRHQPPIWRGRLRGGCACRPAAPHNHYRSDCAGTAARIGQRPTLAFAASIEHAEHLAGAFPQLGVSAQAISGSSRRSEREALFSDWRAGRIQAICNCALLTEGFDFPAIAALLIARPTLSPSLYVQMLGRGTRPAPGKRDCLVIDVMGNRPESDRQVVLPHIIGEVRAEQGKGAECSKQSDPLLKALLGTETESDLSLLDPIASRTIGGRHTPAVTSRPSARTKR